MGKTQENENDMRRVYRLTCRNRIIIIKSMPKHCHLRFRKTSLGHMSIGLPHVRHCNEMFQCLIQ